MPHKALTAAQEEAVIAQDIQFDHHKVSQVLYAVNPLPKEVV